MAGLLTTAGYDVRGRYKSLEELRTGLADLPVDGIILDACIVEDDLEPIKEFHASGYKVILIADQGRSGSVLHSAMLAGASGVLSSDEDAEIFIESVHLVLLGSWVTSANLAPSMIGVGLHEQTHDTERITAADRKLALMVAQGATNREIAEMLMMSEHTAKSHVAALLDKLGFENRQQLAVWVVQQGLYEEPSESV